MPAEPTPADAERVAESLEIEHPEFTEVPVLERDETVPPRPEEIVADVARAKPDPQ